jgi:hypothetical protein
MDAINQVGANAPGFAAPNAAALTPDRTTPAIAGPAMLGDKGIKYEADSRPDAGQLQASIDAKCFKTLQAQAAMCGCTLHGLVGGGYLVCRWGISKELPCLCAVADLLRRIRGVHHG